MAPQRLAILLPCDRFDELSLRRREPEARQLLAGWLALWHPALIDATGRAPEWLAAGEPPEPIGDDGEEHDQQSERYLIILPECSRGWLDDDWLDRAEAAGWPVVAVGGDEEVAGVQRRLLELFEPPARDVPDDALRRFRDVGLAHLMVELLTRQVLYMTNLDEEGFRQQVVGAAELAVRGGDSKMGETGATAESAETAGPAGSDQADTTKAIADKLSAAVDLLADAREYFYPVESHLLDLTLVAETTIGESLLAELRDDRPVNLLISGAVLEYLAEQSPEALRLLREGLERRRVGLIGGPLDERPFALLPPEAIRWHLRRGLAVYERLLHQRPLVFGQRTFGLSPVLPQILHRLGFTAAWHTSLAGGRFPTDTQSRVEWRGVHHQSIPAIVRVPHDAGSDAPLLLLAEQLGDTMDYDHSATQVLAHWPGGGRPWCDSLRRLSSHDRAIGAFATVDDYLEQTAFSGVEKHFEPDEYRSPYLEQAVARGEVDPVSRWQRYFARRAALDVIGAWTAHADCLEALEKNGGGSEAVSLDELTVAVEDALIRPDDDSSATDASLDEALQRAARRLTAAVGAQPAPADDPRRATGTLLLNPHATPSGGCPGFGFHYIDSPPKPTGTVPWESTEPASVASPAAVNRRASESDEMAIESSTGETPVAPSTGETPRAPRGSWVKRLLGGRRAEDAPPPMAERVEDRLLLRNEFAKVQFDVHTGAIRAVNDYRTRGARIAQKVAMRIPDPRERQADSDAHYTIPAVDQWQITATGPTLGEVVCRGRLCDREGRRVAGFEQTTRVRRGSRVIELDITLQPERQPGPDPWRSYYAVRLAWGDATANLYRSVNQANLPTDTTRLEAPYFVDIRGGDAGIVGGGTTRTTLLCGGLPFHRRFGLRKLDTILNVRGEQQQRFRLGLGIDLPHPMPAAMEMLRPPLSVPVVAAPPIPEGWLFHLDCRHALVTHWESCEVVADSAEAGTGETPVAPDPLGTGETPVAPGETCSGLRLRVLETDGRRVEASLRAPTQLAWARKLGVGDGPSVALPVDGDGVTIPLGPHEWAEVELALA